MITLIRMKKTKLTIINDLLKYLEKYIVIFILFLTIFLNSL